MNNYKTIIPLLFGIIFTSCVADTVKFIEDVSIDSGKKIDNINLETISDSIWSYSSDSFIGSVEKLVICDSGFYFFESSMVSSKPLKYCDLVNSKIFEIGRVGKGPNEYISCFDFDILPSQNILIYDRSALRFVEYLPNGDFVRYIYSISYSSV